MGSLDAGQVHLEPYDRNYLDLSWDWLHDPELKALTLTPDFTREQQQAFFASLAGRDDYRIWGVASDDGEKIGAAGIKHIAGTRGEVWLYLGARHWWGRGVGGRIIELCEEQARILGVERLFMIAATDNVRSVRAFEKTGFMPDDASPGEGLVRLSKSLAS